MHLSYLAIGRDGLPPTSVVNAAAYDPPLFDKVMLLIVESQQGIASQQDHAPHIKEEFELVTSLKDP